MTIYTSIGKDSDDVSTIQNATLGMLPVIYKNKAIFEFPNSAGMLRIGMTEDELVTFIAKAAAAISVLKMNSKTSA